MKKEKAKRIARRITAFAAAAAMAATFTFPTEIGEGFFDGFGNAIVASAATDGYYTYSVNSDNTTVTITGYNGSSIKTAEIPKTIDEKAVTAIGDYAFYFRPSLTSITIPDSVTSIGDYAFCNCSSLESITIPDGVTSIGESAFSYCKNLTSITIPGSVTSIGEYVFEACTDLTSISVDGNNPNYCSVKGVLFNKNKTTLLAYPNGKGPSYVIPDGVTSIGEYAFCNCTSLTSIAIPDSVTSIGDCAFGGCTSLTSITIPYSVTSIGNYAFVQCTNLTSISVDGNNPNYCSVEGVLFNKNKTTLLAYPNGKGSSYVIPDGVTFIGESAFDSCTSLTSITIPDSVNSIGAFAFAYCKELTSITIPSGVTSIGNYAFYVCTSLTSITIPDGVTSIGKYAFYNCPSLTSITIPDSVNSIGYYAFDNCSNLTSIFLPERLTSIGNNAIPAVAAQIRYTVDNENVTITAVTLGSGQTSVTIPSTIDGKTVTAVYIKDGATGIDVPASTTQIKYTVESERTVINEVKLGTPQTDCSLPATLFEKPVYLADASLETCPTVTHDHREKTAANCTEKPVCAICVQEYDEHTHVPADDYSKDETGHWHACSGCNEKVDFERHTEDSGTVTKEPTETTEGVKTYKCVKCGYVIRTEAIDPLGTSDPITAFVERLYLNILNRPSDPSKITHIDNLNNGESACKVAFDFVFSSEFAELPISSEERVRRMYLTFLNREADPAGLADWTSVLDNGCSIGHIFYGFTQSNEFTEICEEYGINRGTWEYTENRDRSSKLTAFVSRLYTKAMGRAYDVNGLNDHTGNYLENRDLYQLAYNFIFSSEFIEKNLSDEEFVDVMYRTFFDREADPAGKADWLDRMANQGYTREDVLAGFVGSQECIDLVARFGI